MKRMIFIFNLILIFCYSGFAQTSENRCPEFSIKSPTEVTKAGEEIVFQLITDKNFEKYNVKYFWTVSSGKIVSGQGTKTLTILSNSINTPMAIEANITISGLPEGCSNSSLAFAAVYEELRPEKIDEYADEKYGNIKAQIDALYVELKKHPQASGVIKLKSATKESVLRQIQAIIDAMASKKYDMSRVDIMILIDKGKANTEFWIVPYGKQMPAIENSIRVNASKHKTIKTLLIQRTPKK